MQSQTLLQFSRLYLETGGLLLLSAALLGLSLRGFFKKQSPGEWLRTTHILLVACLLLPWLTLALPKRALLQPAAQIWSGVSSSKEPYTSITPAQLQPVPGKTRALIFSDTLLFLLTSALVLGIALQLLRLQIAFHRLRKFLLRQPQIRKLGKVRVLVSDETSVAFSARSRGRCFVVLPEAVALNPEDRKWNLKHELQHHRQGDMQTALLMELLKAAFFWVPAAAWFSSKVEELQEFVCDAELIGRQPFAEQAYGRCLFRAALTSLDACPRFAGTTGMAASRSGALIQRRLQMILNSQRPASNRCRAIAVTVGTFVLLGGAAFAAKSIVQDRKLTLAEGTAIVQEIAGQTSIPVEMNELVLKALNNRVGDPESRAKTKAALARVPQYLPMIQQKAQKWRVPIEIVSIAIFESGFRADALGPTIHPGGYQSAGIWQFIEPTAKHYHLRVAGSREEIISGKDDRLDPEKETEAAMHYLSDLHAQFHDWRLAIKAYNEGEVHVDSLIQKAGSRDPWALERYASKENYLSGAIAALIVYKKPELLD